MRASALASLPWVIMRGETEYDSSTDFENKTGLVPSVDIMLYLIEASMVMAGCAYWKREKNIAGFDKLRHLNPTSMVLDEQHAINGELVWKRNENGQTRTYTTDEIIYFWYPDPFVEIGPPSSWPVQSALNACGVLANIDEFAKRYFERGAIRAMIFGMQGATKNTADEFETWWNKFIGGIGNVFRTKVISAEKVTPVVVGEGIKELENSTITEEKRKEISLALGVPDSLLFSNAANYATAERDKLNWYEDKIVPEAKIIAGIMNEQIYEPLGLQFKFLPETLDIFQQDETERAEAMSRFIDAITKAKTFEMAQAMFRIYGFEVDDQAMALIERHFAIEAERAAAMPDPMIYQPQTLPTQAPEIETEPVRTIDAQKVGRELSIWQSKCIKAISRGESAAAVPFVPVSIPDAAYQRICDGLPDAATAEAIKALFAAAMHEDEPLPVKSQSDILTDLVEQLKKQNDIMIWKGYP
jgi:phage portal protein BeeE